MDVGDVVMAPHQGGQGRVRAVIVEQLRDRHERDFSDGSVKTYGRVRVRYEDGGEANWDEMLVALARSPETT